MPGAHRRSWYFFGFLLLFLLLQACKIPSSMAPTIAKKVIDAWQKVQTTTQTSKIWPNRTKDPDEVYTVQYRDRFLFSPDQGFRYELLGPADQAGFSHGSVVGTFWMRLRDKQGLLRIDGLPDFDEERATRLLTRIIRENLEIMDFDLSRTEWKGIKVVKIVSTPKPWNDTYYFQSITFTDPITRVIKQALEVNKGGRVGQVWEVVQYQRNLPHEDESYQVPTPAAGEPLLSVDLSKGKPWTGGMVDGKSPWLSRKRKGAHRIHDGSFGPMLVSDYSDGVNMMMVVQYSKQAPWFSVPWSRKVTLRGSDIRICLISGSLFASFQNEDFNGFILAQDNFHHVFHLIEELE